ncbi:FGFR3 [Branchiostoma lanceolatum]|uniref:FGFR3 protein n=1 Tax=Branchiostoma lanceolatum TaxID=7740 RepID=A0A8J9ZFC2_BRALA|nr:FGFR3 [Branchiostoma lanceolatum]
MMSSLCLLLLVIFLPTYATTCPSVCVCDDTFGTYVFCSRRSLTAIPDGIPTDTFRLVLNDNNIAALPVDVFENVTMLEELFLGSNLLHQWPPEVFAGVPLELLSVTFNRIRRLHSDLFAQLPNLTDLILSNNQIEDLRSGVFQSLTMLERLFLDANNIREISDGVLSGLRNLLVLHLYSNDIRIISAGAFSDLKSLTDLRLDQNKITQLPETVFANTSFVSLLLGRNYLTALPAGVFYGCSRLETLALEHNNLTTLPPDVFTGLSELSTANLGFNPWMCDCRLQGLVRWINSSSLTDGDLGNPSCSSPPYTLGVSLRETWSDRFCLHGVCSEEKGDNATCVCDLGWSGLYCQNGSVDQSTTPFVEESSSTIQEQGDTPSQEEDDAPVLDQGNTSPALGVSIATSVGIIVVMIVALAGFLILLRRRKRRRQEDIVMIESFSPFDKDVHRMRMLTPPPIPPRPQVPGLEVDPGRVTLGQRIGSGAFGLVYRATLTRDDESEDVVVKTVKDDATEEDMMWFLQEIRAVVDLGEHENLLGLVGCCTLVRDHLYLITEFMPHGDLKSFLMQCREEETSVDDIYNFQVLQMYQVSRQIARGMDHIARSRYVHGDLAARNVLVGEDLKVKISDFGLAEDIYSRGYRRQDRLRKIPWKWMAPERLQDGAVYTAQSDVWSFGIVLYEISTLGGVPYPDVPSDGLKDQLQAGYRMPKPEGCPHAIYDLMQQCWRRRPSDRPTFRQLELTLDKHLSFHGPEYTQLTPRPAVSGTEKVSQDT